jgi:hypothetical protein
MLRLFAAIALVSSLVYGGEHEYAGPVSLGPVHIDKPSLLSRVLSELGKPNLPSARSYCFESEDHKVFVWFDTLAHHDSLVGDVLIGGSANCLDHTVNAVPSESLLWKTRQGITVGSTVDDVLDAYGKPSSEEKVSGNSYWWIIHGAAPKPVKAAERGSSVLVYRGDSTDLRTAQFGVREGRVVWIFLSCNE